MVVWKIKILPNISLKFKPLEPEPKGLHKSESLWPRDSLGVHKGQNSKLVVHVVDYMVEENA
jgi:hypothetical protein